MLSYFHPLKRLDRSRQKWRQQSLPDCLLPLVEHPYPEPDSDARQLEYLVVDMETTGLDVQNDRILSIGSVEINNMKMDLRTGYEGFINQETVAPSTAVINHIVPEMTSNGATLDDAMANLFQRMSGKVLIAHGMGVERGFIEYYLRRRFDIKHFPFLWLDTLRLEKSLIMNQSEQQLGDFTLGGLRSQYGLPDYPAHEALVDAVATGELYMVLMKRIYSHAKPEFGNLYRRVHSR